MKTGEESDNYHLFKTFQKRKSKLADMKNADQIWQGEFSQMSQKSFANLMSRVTGWLEEWLVFFDAQKHNYQQQVELVEAYNKRGLYTLADKVYHKILKEMNAEEKESIERDSALASLYKAQYYSDNPIKYALGTELLEYVVHSYTNYSNKQSAIYLAELFNWGEIKHVDFITEKKRIDHSINRNELPLAYSLLLELVSKKEATYLYQLTDEIFNNNIQQESIIHMLVIMYSINYYLKLFNKGSIDDPELLIRLYNYAMKTGALFTNGKIPIVRFHNTVNAISTCVPQKDCDAFIEMWADRVSAADIESSKRVALALSHFYYENYSKIVPLLQGIHYEDVYVKIRSNSLLLIAYYEEGEAYDDVLINHIFNLRRQLKRLKAKLSLRTFHAHYNLCDFVEKLAEISWRKEGQLDHTTYPYLFFRNWAKTKSSAQ